MSSRARRVRAVEAVAFEWGAELPAPIVTARVAGAPPPDDVQPPELLEASEPGDAAPPPPDPSQYQAHFAALERDAFAKGYAAGERAGAEAGAKRAEAMLRRLAQTIEELGALRTQMVHQTERQMVQLAIAVARRVVGREIALDGDLIVAMARVALDRLGERTPATIRLHPEDLAAIGQAEWAGPHVRVVGDPTLSRGGCLVESEFGLIDASVDAQFEQLAQAMLGDNPGASERVVPIRRAS